MVNNEVIRVEIHNKKKVNGIRRMALQCVPSKREMKKRDSCHGATI